MRTISAITISTFKEAVRDKVFYNLVIFSLIVLASSRILGLLSSGQEIKIVMDVGLGCISIFGLIISIFIGGNLVYKEIERGTIQTIIVKPIDRHEYIIGKYLGLLLIIFLNLIFMTIGFYVILKGISGTWNFSIIQSIFLIFVELMVISSIAIMFSTFLSPLLSILLTFCLFTMGHLSEDFLFIVEKMEGSFLKFVSKIIYYILPHLSNFNIKNEIVHGFSVSGDYIFSSSLYGVSYSFATIFLAIIIFRNRNFK